MEILVYSEKEMEELGQKIARVLDHNDLVYLIGALGAGKTTLVRGIARGKGYSGRVTSPTFTLMNIYRIDSNPINHFDFYRLNPDEIYDLGLDDYINREGISLIEWPQVGEGYLPREALFINIALLDDDYDRERKVTIMAWGREYQEKIKELQKLC